MSDEKLRAEIARLKAENEQLRKVAEIAEKLLETTGRFEAWAVLTMIGIWVYIVYLIFGK